MSVPIAIPEPTSSDPAYNQRSLPPYLSALRAAGATPIVIPLHEGQDRVAELLAGVRGILLPGSRYDIDPHRYGEEPTPECGEPDPARYAVDKLLLQEAFNQRKPILAICHGGQTLNVWLNGSLIQDLKTAVNHRPGREVAEAHSVRISPGTRLAGLLPLGVLADVQVNSSHHQAIRITGDKLKVRIGVGDQVLQQAISATQLLDQRLRVLVMEQQSSACDTKGKDQQKGLGANSSNEFSQILKLS